MRQGTGPAATCVRPQRKKKERSTMKDSKSGSLPSGAGSLIPGVEVPQSPVFTARSASLRRVRSTISGTVRSRIMPRP